MTQSAILGSVLELLIKSGVARGYEGMGATTLEHCPGDRKFPGKRYKKTSVATK